jgi:hypothetical protein
MGAVQTSEDLTCMNKKQNSSIKCLEGNEECPNHKAVHKNEEIKSEKKGKKNIFKKIFYGYSGVDFSGAWGLMSKN